MRDSSAQEECLIGDGLRSVLNLLGSTAATVDARYTASGALIIDTNSTYTAAGAGLQSDVQGAVGIAGNTNDVVDTDGGYDY